jgi:hypothetical protein
MGGIDEKEEFDETSNHSSKLGKTIMQSSSRASHVKKYDF